MYKEFLVNGNRYTFVTSGKTPLKYHKNDVDLCGCGAGTGLTICIDEVDEAIKQLQESGCYKGFSVSEHEKELKERQEKQDKQNALYWKKIHDERIEKENRMKQVIEKVKSYCDNNGGLYLVYNKLDECIKNGYFVVYDYMGHKSIMLADAGINVNVSEL